MKASAFKYSVLSLVSSVTIGITLLIPFHAFLTVWLSSVVGHYTLLRLWKEILLLLCGICAVYLLFTDAKIRSQTISRRLVWLIGVYAAVNVVWGLIAFHRHAVTAEALGYGLIVNLRFLAFFLISWVVSLRLVRMHSHWQWITLWPAAAVALFGLLEVFVLPGNFLSHFGYGMQTIPASETINHNAAYMRIMSTLRGANPLGAYLVVPLSMLSVLMLRRKIEKKQIALLIALLLTLFFSFSRSAWIGAILSLLTICLYTFQDRRGRIIMASAVGALIVIGAGSLAVLRHNDHFENLVFHTQEESTITSTSNMGHSSAIKDGVHDIVHNPLGSGVGTAGPASTYNDHRARISENYFLQIGQETGVIGLVMIVTIMGGVGYLLWLRRSDALALSLFASLVGLTVVNLLSHAWADDTLAYVWWGLAGIAMAPNLKELREQRDKRD